MIAAGWGLAVALLADMRHFVEPASRECLRPCGQPSVGVIDSGIFISYDRNCLGTAVLSAAQEAPVLVSQRYGLKGKPDGLVRTASGDVIPVERKKSRAPKRPYAGDLIQASHPCVAA